MAQSAWEARDAAAVWRRGRAASRGGSCQVAVKRILKLMMTGGSERWLLAEMTDEDGGGLDIQSEAALVSTFRLPAPFWNVWPRLRLSGNNSFAPAPCHY